MRQQRTVAGASTSPSPRSKHFKDRRRRTTGAIAMNVNPDTIAAKRAQMVRAGEHGSFSDGRDAWVESGPSPDYTFLYCA
jgi:hypothetical protein